MADEPQAGLRATWRTPTPYGRQGAVDIAGSVAAPLLAGFSVTLIAQVIENQGDLWWADLAFVLLVVAALFLVAAVQAAFMARQYAVTPGELEEWWPDLEDPRRWDQVRGEQWAHAEIADAWSLRFRRAYQLGLVALLAALPVIPAPDEPIEPLRIAAIALAGTGAMAGVVWVGADIVLGISRWRTARRERREARKQIEEAHGNMQALPEPLARLEQRLAAEKAKRDTLRERERQERTKMVQGFPRLLRPLACVAVAAATRLVPQLQPMEPPVSAETPSSQREAFAASRVESLMQRLVDAVERSEDFSVDWCDPDDWTPA